MSQIILTIAPATSEDLSFITAIEQQCFPDPWSLKSFEQALEDPAFWLWVAKEKNSVIGYCVCQVVQQEAELHNIAVAPTHQHRQIATQLLRQLIESLREKKVEEIFLITRASNTFAQRLYQKFGFQKIGARPHFYRHPAEEGWVLQSKL